MKNGHVLNKYHALQKSEIIAWELMSGGNMHFHCCMMHDANFMIGHIQVFAMCLMVADGGWIKAR
jgi:hypothetical protein